MAGPDGAQRITFEDLSEEMQLAILYSIYVEDIAEINKTWGKKAPYRIMSREEWEKNRKDKLPGEK